MGICFLPVESVDERIWRGNGCWIQCVGMSSIIKGCVSCRKISDVGRNVKERIFSNFSPLVLPLLMHPSSSQKE